MTEPNEIQDLSADDAMGVQGGAPIQTMAHPEGGSRPKKTPKVQTMAFPEGGNQSISKPAPDGSFRTF